MSVREFGPFDAPEAHEARLLKELGPGAYIDSRGTMDSASVMGTATAGWAAWRNVPELASPFVSALGGGAGNSSTDTSSGVVGRHL